MFCSCSADYASTPPNTHGLSRLPGHARSVATINKKAIEYAVMTALGR